ncbi:MAG: hypothetical protein ACTSRK_21455 [Promethearchaeota archaeon]
MISAARTIGVNITLEQESEANYWGITLDRAACSADWDMYCGMMGMGGSPEMNMLMMWESSAAYPAAMPIGGDAEVDEAIWNFMTTSPDQTATRQTYADAIANRINNELFAFTWIPGQPWMCAYSTEWTNVSSMIDFRPQYIRLVTDETEGKISGYSFLILGLISSLVIVSLMRKKKK